MTINQYTDGKVIINTSNPSFVLMKRCIEAIEKNGYQTTYINGIGRCEEIDKLVTGDKIISIKEVYKHNAAKENVSVEIRIHECKINSVGYLMTKELTRIKVPKDASDKVINNRINKALEFLK